MVLELKLEGITIEQIVFRIFSRFDFYKVLRPINRKGWPDFLKYYPGRYWCFIAPRAVLFQKKLCPGAGLLTTLKKFPEGLPKGYVGTWN